MKPCPKCKKIKSTSEFYMRRTGNRAGEYYEKCKTCMKTRGREYYQLNHDHQLKLALIRRKRAYYEKRNFLNNAKSIPCADCGKLYPYFVMDFDHMKPKEKIKEVSYMATRNWSLDKIIKEVEKCEVVCANCHRIRTYSKICNNHAAVA